MFSEIVPELGAALPIDHVAIVVRDTSKALRLYVEVLGMWAEPSEVVPTENVKITFLHGANLKLEVLEPLPGDSGVARFLEKRGEGFHHLCLVVPDLTLALESLVASGYQLIDQQPRRNYHGRLLAFVHPKSTNGVLIELYQADSAARRGAAGGWTDGDAASPEPSDATGTSRGT